MVLSGKVIKGQKTIYQKKFADTCSEDASFRDKLEDCLLKLCKDADIPAPIWLSKNTAELARFKKTSFFPEQYVEEVQFSRFEIEFVRNYELYKK